MIDLFCSLHADINQNKLKQFSVTYQAQQSSPTYTLVPKAFAKNSCI